jgi:hypothetical protein
MTWAPLQPTNSTKLRSAPGVIRTNWAAIEAGLVPFKNLRIVKLAVGNVPTSVANQGFLYGKQSNSNTELFYINDNSQIVQLTRGGKIANTDIPLLTSGVSFDDSYFYKASNLIAARASVADDGTVNMADGITSANTGTGLYTITVDSGRLQTNTYQILTTAFTSASSDHMILNLLTKPAVNSATTTVITLETIKRDGGGHKNTSFEIAILGGR